MLCSNRNLRQTDIVTVLRHKLGEHRMLDSSCHQPLVLEPMVRTKVSSFEYYYFYCRYSYHVNCSILLVFQLYSTYFLNSNTHTRTHTNVFKHPLLKESLCIP